MINKELGNQLKDGNEPENRPENSRPIERELAKTAHPA